MKPFALYTAALIIALFAGCEENAVDPIAAHGSAKPDPAFQTMNIKERIELAMPDGRVEFAAVEGEVVYRLAPAKNGNLSKEIPLTQIYDLTLTGKGQIMVEGAIVKDKFAFAKPEFWYFAGNMTSMVEEGARGIEATFTIQGAKWTAHYHVMFSIIGGALGEQESLVDFHPAAD